MEELRSGLWYWTAVHPTWYDNEVGSYAWDAGSTVVLLDPLSPPTLVDELASGKSVATVLTCDWHDRSAPELVERLGSRSTRRPAETASWTESTSSREPSCRPTSRRTAARRIP